MSRLLVRWSGRTRLLTSSSGMPSNLSCFFLSLYVFARFLASASSALKEWKKKKVDTEGLNNTLDSFMLRHTIQRKARATISLDRKTRTFRVCFLSRRAGELARARLGYSAFRFVTL